ncbi:hypothetical protein SAMN06296386_101156 [Lachnospiraceae bacterium]|nr:hypothetical protein SAMN06296386_101156 [Lachnospiraceae bacterium]
MDIVTENIETYINSYREDPAILYRVCKWIVNQPEVLIRTYGAESAECRRRAVEIVLRDEGHEELRKYYEDVMGSVDTEFDVEKVKELEEAIA